MTDQRAAVAGAFSRKAEEYDQFGKDHPNLSRMRRSVYTLTLKYLQPGDRILELNAGTGTDAVFFAREGFEVHATDLASGMVAAIEEKIVRYGLSHRLRVSQHAFDQLDQVSGGPYQHVFSNFGGLNCVDTLRPLGLALPRLLSPGAHLTLVIMPPYCPWEWLAAARGDWQTAFRRLRPQGTLAHVSGHYFRTTYYNPVEVQRQLGAGYELLHVSGLSVFAPPADHKQFAHRHRSLYRWLVKLDERLAGQKPFNGMGDFSVLSLRWRG